MGTFEGVFVTGVQLKRHNTLGNGNVLCRY